MAGLLSLAVEALIVAALLWPHAPPAPPRPALAPLEVNLIEPPRPKLPAPLAPVQFAALTPAPARIPPPVFKIASPLTRDASDRLSPSQLAGAAAAGKDSGGGCDIAWAVQQALRRDPMVRAATLSAGRIGRATMLWDGDWVRSGDQEGKGLSAVREAILWEVAFAPQACRNTPMHGLVLLSLADGNTRFAVGTGNWRWSDLLDVRGR